MRTIKFRGKSIENNQWVYGSLVIDSMTGDKMAIIEWADMSEVNKNGGAYVWVDVFPETVGQFIGLRDKKGNDIYKDDIVESWSSGSKGTFKIHWRQESAPCWMLYPAYQCKQFWSISATEHKKGKQFISVTGNVSTSKKEGFYDDGIEIIGNTHDNPEIPINVNLNPL